MSTIQHSSSVSADDAPYNPRSLTAIREETLYNLREKHASLAAELAEIQWIMTKLPRTERQNEPRYIELVPVMREVEREPPEQIDSVWSEVLAIQMAVTKYEAMKHNRGDPGYSVPEQSTLQIVLRLGGADELVEASQQAGL